MLFATEIKDSIQIVYYVVVGTVAVLYYITNIHNNKDVLSSMSFFVSVLIFVLAAVILFTILNYTLTKERPKDEDKLLTSNEPTNTIIPDNTSTVNDADKYYTNQISYLNKLNDQIQNGTLTEDEKNQKLSELNRLFNELVQTVTDCSVAKKLYYFEKEKLEPYYVPNKTIVDAMHKIEQKCLNYEK